MSRPWVDFLVCETPLHLNRVRLKRKGRWRNATKETRMSLKGAYDRSGIAALLLERNSPLTPADIRRILTTSAKRLAPGDRNDDFGSGLIDPLKALQSADPRTATTAPPRRQVRQATVPVDMVARTQFSKRLLSRLVLSENSIRPGPRGHHHMPSFRARHRVLCALDNRHSCRLSARSTRAVRPAPRALAESLTTRCRRVLCRAPCPITTAPSSRRSHRSFAVQ